MDPWSIESIDERARAIEGMQAKGDYSRSHELAEVLLSELSSKSIPREVHCRILLLAARSSYYVGQFERSESLLEEAAKIVPGLSSKFKKRFSLEQEIVRANVLRRRGNFREALERLRALDETSCADPKLLLEKLLIEGACYFYLNEVPAAEESLERALGIAIEERDSSFKARVLTMLGLLSETKGLHEAALEYLTRAIELSRAGGDMYGEAAASLDLAIALCRAGRFEEAAGMAERARAIFECTGWKLGACRAILALGNAERLRGERAKAFERYREALILARSLEANREVALALLSIGAILADTSHRIFAERCYCKALRIAESISPEGDLAIEANRRIAELFLESGRGDSASPFLRRSLGFAQKSNDRLELGAVYRCMGRASVGTGDWERAERFYEQSIGTFGDAGCLYELARTKLEFAKALFVHFEECFAVSRDGNGGPSSIEKAWRYAVEASHLLGAMDSSVWASEALELVAEIAEKRSNGRPQRAAPRVSSRIVEISPSRSMELRDGFVAVSAAMHEVWRQIRFVASFDRPVLITGETGVGKELVARLIHDLSARRKGPFVAVNCAAVPDHLFESEFFGHRRGSFTGALSDREGLFEAANGGTLFLDEVAELSPLEQVKFLRVLEEKKVRRIGENAERVVDVRIVSATNQNLDEKIEKQTLRRDFFYRLNAEHIHIPPLRSRPEDIAALVAYFYCGNGGEVQKAKVELEALRCLQRYDWPGNVRELAAVVERLRSIAGDGVVTLDMLPERIRECSMLGVKSSKTVALPCGDGAERLRRALAACRGNKAAAARLLGISRGTLYKELRRLGLMVPSSSSQISE